MTQLKLCLLICQRLVVTNQNQISTAQNSDTIADRSKSGRKTELQGYRSIYFISEYDIIELY